MVGVTADPTDEEIASWTDLESVADWVALPHRPATPADGSPLGSEASPRGQLYRAFGAEPTTPYRLVGAMSKELYDEGLAAWKVNGARPSILLRSAGALLGTACRIAAGRQDRDAVVRQKEHELQLAKAAGEAQQAADRATIHALRARTRRLEARLGSAAESSSPKRRREGCRFAGPDQAPARAEEDARPSSGADDGGTCDVVSPTSPVDIPEMLRGMIAAGHSASYGAWCALYPDHRTIEEIMRGVPSPSAPPRGAVAPYDWAR